MAKTTKVQEQPLESIMWNCRNALRGTVGGNEKNRDAVMGFISWGSTRDILQFETLGEIKIPIPDIGVQQSIVNIYNAYIMRREINEKMKTQLKEICPILIKGSLEEAGA